jgi:hypothetical protein
MQGMKNHHWHAIHIVSTSYTWPVSTEWAVYLVEVNEDMDLRSLSLVKSNSRCECRSVGMCRCEAPLSDYDQFPISLDNVFVGVMRPLWRENASVPCQVFVLVIFTTFSRLQLFAKISQ